MGPEAINPLKLQISDMARQQAFDRIIISYEKMLNGGAVRLGIHDCLSWRQVMDRDLLNRVSGELACRSGADVDVQGEMARLRDFGYSIVESCYIIVKAFNVSLVDAKRMAVVIESSKGKFKDIEEFHDRLLEAN